MSTTSLYSDIVLPAASFYEKNDINTTDMHSFIHPFVKAVSCPWEAKSDWEIFELLGQAHLATRRCLSRAFRLREGRAAHAAWVMIRHPNWDNRSK